MKVYYFDEIITKLIELTLSYPGFWECKASQGRDGGVQSARSPENEQNV